MKFSPWSAFSIEECGEELLEIPTWVYRVQPHPYQALGAPYGQHSPYLLRERVLRKLHAAHQELQLQHPGWRFSLFDAYRPRAVQQFMVDHTYQQLRQEQPQATEDALWQQVFKFWALPSNDPATPPAHSTGAALDLSLIDEQGRALNMGTEIDDFTERAAPDFFARSSQPEQQQAHNNRLLLRKLLCQQGFHQHPNEWWHFSFGDQLWAWQQQHATDRACPAIYGCVEDIL